MGSRMGWMSWNLAPRSKPGTRRVRGPRMGPRRWDEVLAKDTVSSGHVAAPGRTGPSGWMVVAVIEGHGSAAAESAERYSCHVMEALSPSGIARRGRAK